MAPAIKLLNEASRCVVW